MQQRCYGVRGLPERTDESPNLADECDEDTDTCRLLGVAVDSISDEHRCDDLVTRSSDGNSNDRCDVPMQIWRLRRADKEHNHSGDSKQKSRVAKPQPKLW